MGCSHVSGQQVLNKADASTIRQWAFSISKQILAQEQWPLKDTPLEQSRCSLLEGKGLSCYHLNWLVTLPCYKRPCPTSSIEGKRTISLTLLCRIVESTLSLTRGCRTTWSGPTSNCLSHNRNLHLKSQVVEKMTLLNLFLSCGKQAHPTGLQTYCRILKKGVSSRYIGKGLTLSSRVSTLRQVQPLESVS